MILMGRIITVVEAHIQPNFYDRLRSLFENIPGIPEGLAQSFLSQNKDDPSLWQVVSVWASIGALQKMRASTEKPAAISIFEQCEAKPSLKIFVVASEK